MLISVIIPVYNLAQYVRYPITSVLEQVPSDDIEIIVVDDGSTDESLGVIKGFEGGRSDVKVVTQKNAGVSAARNAGLSIATGKYVTFVDGDDVVSPDAFKILTDGIESDREAVLSCGNHLRTSSYTCDFGARTDDATVETSEAVLEKLLLEKYDVSTCGKLFIREKIGDLRFCEGRRINEDKYFLISYLLSNPGKVVNINQTIYGYYVREGSASNSSFSDKHLDMLYFSEKIENDVVASYPELTKAARYNNIVAHLAVLKKIVRSKGTKANKQLLSDVRKKVLALSKGLTTSELGNHKQEILMLRLGIPVYVLCVRLHDGMKR